VSTFREKVLLVQVQDQIGVLRSLVFPGLQLAVDALPSGDMQQVLAVTQKGVGSEKHQGLVTQLTQLRLRS